MCIRSNPFYHSYRSIIGQDTMIPRERERERKGRAVSFEMHSQSRENRREKESKENETRSYGQATSAD